MPSFARAYLGFVLFLTGPVQPGPEFNLNVISRRNREGT